MAFATTTLSAACAITDTVVFLTSATSVAAGRYLLIDQEMMQVAASYPGTGTTVPVLRGRDGTATTAHKVTANVTHGNAGDFATPGAQGEVTYSIADRSIVLTSITATSTLVLPSAGQDQRVILNGTSVITLTVPAPTKDMDGVRLSFIANGAAAHVLSFTGGLSGAGASYVKFTMNGTAPTAFEVFACNGLWVAPAQTPAAGVVTNVTGTISA